MSSAEKALRETKVTEGGYTRAAREGSGREGIGFPVEAEGPVAFRPFAARARDPGEVDRELVEGGIAAAGTNTKWPLVNVGVR